MPTVRLGLLTLPLAGLLVTWAAVASSVFARRENRCCVHYARLVVPPREARR
jgi:hypothetical protein